MEDVLEIYKRPYNPAIPVVCMDEQPTQLIKETRKKIAVEPGKAERVDYTAVNFMFTEPLGGWRKINIRQRKTAIDWAYEMKELLDKDYADADKVILVMDNLNTHKVASFYEAFEPKEAMDNLNTHKVASFYEAFEPKEARRLIERLEIHYTPNPA